MKKSIYKFSLGLLTLFAVLGCDDRLDIEPFQQIDAKVALESEADIRSAIIGIYGKLGGGELYGTNFVLLPELQGGESYLNWSGSFGSFREVRNKTMNNRNEEARRTWVEAYSAINVINQVLENIDKVKNEETKSTLEGEAYMIRGMLIFELTRMYGKPYQAGTQNLAVPIVLTTSSSISDLTAKPARATVGECYTQALNDLTKSLSLLPDENGVRGDKYTALAFLVRLYLQKGDYVKANEAAEEIISSGKYNLSPSVTSVFRNKNTSESIFEIQQNLQNNAGSSNDGLVTFFSGLPASSSNTSVGYDSYTGTIGRRDAHVNDGLYSRYEATDKRRNELFYIGRTSRNYSGKYVDYGQNFVVIRYSEILLARAETAFMAGDAVTALKYLNTVRERAGASLYTTVSLARIMEERTLELAFEGLRIHDIKRMKGSTGDFAWDNSKLIFPIPQREIEVNASLVQNEGY